MGMVVGFRKGKEDAEEENIHLGFLNRYLWGGKFETITDHHWFFKKISTL